MHEFITLTAMNKSSTCHIKPGAILAITCAVGPPILDKRGSLLMLEYGHTVRVRETPEVVEAIRLKYYQDHDLTDHGLRRFRKL